MAALVITLVDVVVFLPISFLPGAVGLFLREFGLVVSVATLTSLFVSFTVTPALAAHWSLPRPWKPWPIIARFGEGFDRLRGWYVESALLWGFANRRIVFWVSFGSLLLALLMLPLGIVGFEYIPTIDRGQFFLTITYPTGTPLETTRRAVLAVERMVDQSPDVASNALAGAYQGNLPGYVNNGAVGQLHIFLRTSRSRSTTQTAQAMQHRAAHVPECARRRDSRDQHDRRHRAADRYGREHAGRRPVGTGGARLRRPRVDSRRRECDDVRQSAFAAGRGAVRSRPRALAGVSIGTAADAVRAAFGGTLATQFPTADGLKDVQVIYPQTAQASLAGIASIPIRATGGSIVNVGDVTILRANPPRRSLRGSTGSRWCTSEQTSPTEANSRTCNADSTTASRR